MSDNLRQRRGKKPTNGSSSTKDATNDKQQAPIEQLREAQAKLIVSRNRTADLHAAWLNQMFRMSLIVIFVTLHQIQKPIQSCIGDIKSLNEGGSSDNDIISGMDAIVIIFGYNYYEILAVVTAFLLAFILIPRSSSSLELNTAPYFLSSALVPIQLGFYFNTTQPASCVGDGVELVKRNFPAVVIYHTIVTLAAWFMKNGMDQCDEHVRLVTDSIADFERMDKKLQQKKQLLKAKK
ncbi:hypothetical protein ACHAWO_012611 [Cyclotella atomus]|jgi:hypothetical protein|uniref:Transmembrane protein n=1 Tax=Cyclotella atomus TaxID=382360 RepID=A0ABD3PV62_9STRA